VGVRFTLTLDESSSILYVHSVPLYCRAFRETTWMGSRVVSFSVPARFWHHATVLMLRTTERTRHIELVV
jgi:hypothetical protein